MKKTLRALLQPLLFTLGGAAAGYAYYALVGCATGTCAITSSPVRSALYFALVGFLLSFVFRKGCRDGCST